ncbi:hypothetical protein DSM43519_00541 [Mycobacterium marinum]|nr:hypothetical protein DSM43519_00541 [Mycobacterium marinum]RFZ30833.1 hypothetical protein DSM44344_00080 [Mycobacterium marinum]RFZ35435.1 hypothetical protein NCTC2275_01999 [Mycobacterium marinum]
MAAYACTVADLDVMIFTFTETEAEAVKSLLQKYLDTGPADSTLWRAEVLGERIIVGTLADDRTVRIEHKSLRAQGNVTAAGELTRAAYDDEKVHGEFADYYIFYACCGALDGKLIGQIFRISSVSYMSLGSVKRHHGQVVDATTPKQDATLRQVAELTEHGADPLLVKQRPPAAVGTTMHAPIDAVTETVKLKNKWIVRTYPGEQPPLGSIELPTGSPTAPGRLRLLDLPDASVLATDKVIEIPPAKTAPTPRRTPPDGPIFNAGEWTYGETLAHCREYVKGNVLIDMETFGIASAMEALRLENNVLVLRVVTDALTNKADQPDYDQLALLQRQLPALDEVLAIIMGTTDDAG